GAVGRRRAPGYSVAAARAAVEGIGPVGGGRSVGPAVEGEPGAGDAVAVRPDKGAEVRGCPLVARQGVIAKDDIGELAGPVRQLERDDDAAVVEHPELDAVGILERVHADGRSASGGAE